MAGTSDGVQDDWAFVRTVHCCAQDGRFDASRVTAWAEMMGEEGEEEDEACEIKDNDEGDGAMDDLIIDDKICTAVGSEAPTSWLRAEDPQV